MEFPVWKPPHGTWMPHCKFRRFEPSCLYVHPVSIERGIRQQNCCIVLKEALQPLGTFMPHMGQLDQKPSRPSVTSFFKEVPRGRDTEVLRAACDNSRRSTVVNIGPGPPSSRVGTPCTNILGTPLDKIAYEMRPAGKTVEKQWTVAAPSRTQTVQQHAAGAICDTIPVS